jgi:hypothetical protein
MAQNEVSLDSPPAANRRAAPGTAAKVAAIMAIGGGVLGGGTCGWEGVLVVAVICGVIGGIVGRVLATRISLWSGFIITMIKATLGGCCVGMLICLTTILIMAGLSLVSINLLGIPSEGVFVVVFEIPIAAAAGLVTGAVLWWDSGKKDC